MGFGMKSFVCVFQTSRTTRSDEERDNGWDAWGTWSDCSRTCGGGASYSLRRCLNGGLVIFPQLTHTHKLVHFYRFKNLSLCLHIVCITF